MEVVSISDTAATVRTYVYEVIKTISGKPHSWIPLHPNDIRFHVAVACDTLYQKLYLQNEVETATKAYNVFTDMAAGKNVDPEGTVGDYIIQSGAGVAVHAGESILLADGFTASEGAYFSAYVEPFFTCIHQISIPEKGNEQVPVIKEYSVEKTNFSDAEETTKESEFYLKLYPNPSMGSVTIEYNLTQSDFVEICLLDNFGKSVYTLKNRTHHDSGVYKIILSGVELPSGTYFCRLKTEHSQKTEKLLIVR